MEIEGVTFPALTTPPGSSMPLFLAGAGVRGLDIGGQFIVFTVIAIYLERSAILSLTTKWVGRTTDELAAAPDFYRDIYTGSFQKLTRVTMVKPLTGQQYSEKVTENCVAQWKAAGTYTEAKKAAVEKFKEVFKAENFLPGSSILFYQNSSTLTITFAKMGKSPEAAGSAVIDNKPLSEAILESIIGEHGVSPAARQSLARRLSLLMKEPRKAEAAKQLDALELQV